MKVLAILPAFISQAVPQQTVQVKQELAASQVLAWRTYYGFVLGKDVSHYRKSFRK